MVAMLFMAMFNCALSQNTFTDDFVIPLTRPGEAGKLLIQLHAGSIEISGHSGNNIEVLVNSDRNEEEEKEEVRADGLKKILSRNIDLQVHEDDNEVKIMSHSDDFEVNLQIKVPANFTIKLNSHEGDVIAQNIKGELEINSHEGEIRLENISGSVVATCYDGDLKATLTKVKADTPMAFSSYDGNIDVTFPADLKTRVKARTDEGDIFTDYEVKMVDKAVEKKQDKDSGSFSLSIGGWTTMDINGGGPEFMFRTWDGDIFIRKGK